MSTEEFIESVAADVLSILQITCNERFRNECFRIFNTESSQEVSSQVKHRMTELARAAEQTKPIKRRSEKPTQKSDDRENKKRSKKPRSSKSIEIDSLNTPVIIRDE